MSLETVSTRISALIDIVDPEDDSGEAKRFLIKARDEVRAALLREQTTPRERSCPSCGAHDADLHDTGTPNIYFCPICPGFFSTTVVSHEAAGRYAKIGTVHTGARPPKLLFYDFLMPRYGRQMAVFHAKGWVASNGRREVFLDEEQTG